MDKWVGRRKLMLSAGVLVIATTGMAAEWLNGEQAVVLITAAIYSFSGANVMEHGLSALKSWFEKRNG